MPLLGQAGRGGLMSEAQTSTIERPAAQLKPRSPADFPDSPLAQAMRQPMMLGLFLDLQDIARSSLETSTTWQFDYNAEVVRRADELGFELAFSRTQWLPKGGYDGEASLDSFIALGAMAPVTKRIILISTRDEADFADLIAASPAIGFLPKSRLSAAAIRTLLARDE